MQHRNRTRRHVLKVLSATTLLSSNVWAQDAWPQKPIKLIVPFAPGGSNDNIARLISQKMSKQLGQPIVIENRGGSGGLIGTDSVAQAMADGYTLLFASSSLVTNALSGKKVKHDPLKAFTPIGKAVSASLAIVCSSKLPFNNLKELVNYAKANPGSLNYGTAGIGATNHLATELFAYTAGIKLTHVPYKGIGQSYNDLMGGSLQMMVPSLTAILPHVKSGTVRALAVTSKTRSPLLPDAPTVIESGYPSFHIEAWFGLLGPAGLSPAITAKLNQSLNQALSDPEILKVFQNEALTPLPGPAKSLLDQMQSDMLMWKKVIADAQIKLDES